METYLFKFSGCLVVFWLVYYFMLERQNRHHFKRFYLLGAITAALLIPTLTVTEYVEPIVRDFEIAPMFISIEPEFAQIPVEEVSSINFETVLWLVYGLGVLLFLVRFIWNLTKMYHHISKNEKVQKQSFIYVLLKESRIPHSFFNYIFFNKIKFEADSIPSEVILHEETHAKQFHSLDIILLELLQIVFWFHPLIYIIKHHIKLNHEFLADQAVLKQGVDAKSYQTILLQFSSNTPNYKLASAINYSSIKKRFTVMKTQTSKTKIWLSSLVLLPIIAILFYSFSTTEYVEKEPLENAQLINEVEPNNEITDDIEIYHYTEQLYKVKDENGNYVPKTFNKLNDYYKKKWLYTEPTPFTQKQISETEFETIKDEKKYVIMIDGAVIKNDELSKYSPSDFVTFSNSTISELAEMKERFHYNLITKKGLNTFTKLALISYKSALEDYNNKLSLLQKNKAVDKDKMLYDYAFIKQLFERFTPEIIASNNLQLPDVPNEGATEAMMKEYNDWIIKFVTTNYIEYSKYKRIVAIYDIMTEAQRKSVEPYPVIPNTNLSKVKPTTPSKAQFESWKNENEFALWIDGKHVSNSELNNYKAEDIVHFVGSKVHKNAQSEKFPQPFQFSLYTKQGFKNTYQESAINLYKEVSNTYSVALKDYLKGPQTDNSELRMLKAQADKLYNQFTEKELKDYNLKPAPPVPAQKIKNPPTQKEVAAYNAWVKKINTVMSKAKASNNNEYPIIKQKDLNKYKTIYNTMSNSQKENSEAWPSLQPFLPPPPAPIPTNATNTERARILNLSEQQKVTAKQVVAYNNWAKKLNKLMTEAKMSNDYSNLIIKQKDITKYRRIYDIMTTSQKKTAEAWPSFPPPPPPPPPPANSKNSSFLEYIIEMEKNGATFFYNNKKITATEAKTIAKTNKDKKTDMLTQLGDDGKYIVKLSDNKDKLKPLPPPAPKSQDLKVKTVKGYPTKSEAPVEHNESSLDFVIRIAKTNAKFFYELSPITSDKAIAFLKKNPKLNINAQNADTNEALVYISKKPTLIGVKGKQKSLDIIVNGNLVETAPIKMTKAEFKKLKLTLSEGKVTRFKLKIPGKKTQIITGNTINKETIALFNSIEKLGVITLFDIKDAYKSKIPPVIISITDQ